jgi:putative hydrolase of the HAD superfamily
VEEAIVALAARYTLVLVTKGDLMHQEQKVARSGLAERFDHVEIVSEKDEATYSRILRDVGVGPERFVMVGNSVRSDVLPVLAIGGRAVHVPYHLTWDLEVAHHDGSVPTLRSLAELPAWLAAQG